MKLSGHSALELLHREQLKGSIVTFCASIDGMIGGGVALGKVTEFCGAPGLGKTQIRYELISKSSLDLELCMLVYSLVPRLCGKGEGEGTACSLGTRLVYVLSRTL